jgi:UPF0271 protein
MLLNLDAGEHPSEPEELWALADVLCVACGGHAGDEFSMTRVVSFIAARRSAGLSMPLLGAHPSYPDRANFGRVSLPALSADALESALIDQLTALARIGASHGLAIEFVKPHGALYHDAAKDAPHALAIVNAARRALAEGFTVIGPSRGLLADAARKAGIAYMREGFADRRAYPDGTLVPRSEPDALITDPAAAAACAIELVAAGQVDTICCHADTPGAHAIVSAVRTALGPVRR